MNYPILFSKGKIGKLTIQNRVVMTAMEIGLAHFNGNATSKLIRYYTERAKGQVGLIICGITRVNNIHGVSTPRQLSMAKNSNIRSQKKLTQSVHEYGTKIFVQLHHPGRQNYTALVGVWPMMAFFSHIIPRFDKLFGPLVAFYNWLLNHIFSPAVVAPSAVECQHVQQKTRALKIREIKKLEQQFIQAALRAKKANFDGVELHAAHGYLIQQFLSPRTNLRTDEYGGSFENRIRFLKNILTGIKKVCGSDFPVSVRLSVEEFYVGTRGKDGNPISKESNEAGILLEEGLKIAEAVEAMGADVLNISSATYETTNHWLEPVTYQPGWRKYLAAEVKKRVSIPVVAANLIRSGAQAESQLKEGIQDFIGLGRPLLADPHWAKKIASGNEALVTRCIRCLTCFESLNQNAWKAKPLACAVNPLWSKESDWDKIETVGEGKKALVVGAGVSGLEAGLVLAKRGFQTTIVEAKDQIGGQAFLASRPPQKEALFHVVEDLLTKLKKAKVTILMETKVDLRWIVEKRPDFVVLATGSLPLMPPIEGSRLPHVHSVDGILSGSAELKGKNWVVIGSGLSGLETADFLAEKGKKVTVVEMLEKIGPTAYFQNREDVLEHLERYKTIFLPSHRVQLIDKKEVELFSLKEKKMVRIPADGVVLSIGNRSYNPLEKQLKSLNIPVALAGDCIRVGRIKDGIQGGFDAAMQAPS